MARPHPALYELAAGRPLPEVPDRELAVLLASAAEHRMTGLLWTRVMAGELALPPQDAVAVSRQDLREQAHHLRLWRVVDQVQRELAEAGIEIALAKGISAEHRWYSRLGERPCNDLDLVLAPDAVGSIDEVLRRLHPQHALRGSTRHLMTSGVLQSIDLDVNGIELDLHADLLKYELPTRQPHALFDSRVSIVGPRGVTASALSAEMSLVHFLLHLNKDNFARLLAYADVARILSVDRDRLDWDLIFDFIRGEGLETHVLSALQEVVSRLGLRAPATPVVGGARSVVWRYLWPESDRLRGSESLQRHRHRLLWIPWTARGRLPEAFYWWFRRRVFPPAALLALYYPGIPGPYVRRLAVGRWRQRQERLAQRRSPSSRTAWTGGQSAADGRASSCSPSRESLSYELVIVHYRGAAVLDAVLRRLPTQVPVIVVDNSAATAPVRDLTALRPGTRYIDTGGNVGFAAAANLGAKSSTADVVIFLNPDCAPSIAVLEELVGTLQGDERVAACGPALVSSTGAIRQSGGWQPTVTRSLVHAVGAHRVLRRAGIYAEPRLQDRLDVGWLSGACLAVRREVLLSAGGFDESYFMYQEDMALGRRVADQGLRMLLRADVQVVHAGGGSSDVPSTWLWQQRGAALTRYIAQENSAAAALAMRMLLSGGFLVRGLYHLSFGTRARVVEMLVYSRTVRRGDPEPAPPSS